jgi:hypothetical protein
LELRVRAKKALAQLEKARSAETAMRLRGLAQLEKERLARFLLLEPEAQSVPFSESETP